MGAWGSSNFENDSAMDVIAAIHAEWIREIQRILNSYDNPVLTPLDLEDSLMTYLELIRRICQASGPKSRDLPILPSADDLRAWQDRVTQEHLKYFGESARSGEPRE
jgi:hypothetical protein